jgi:hypothetical protein
MEEHDGIPRLRTRKTKLALGLGLNTILSLESEALSPEILAVLSIQSQKTI